MLLLLAAHRQGRRQRRLRRQVLAQLTKWAELPEGEGLRPREPALHRRLRRATWPTTPTSRSRRSSPSAPTRMLCEMRGEHGRGGRRTASWRRSMAAQWVKDGRRRRPLPPGLRQARHLEPEVQPRLGQAAGPRPLPARGRPQGDRLLPHGAEPVRPAAGQPQATTPSSTGSSGPRRWPTRGTTSRCSTALS